MERYFEIYLNAGDSVAPTIHVNQYDDSETWVFTVFDEDGNVVIPTDASICGVKADGHIILNSASVSDGKVLVDETKQMTAAPGKAVFELLLNGATHGTANFNVFVEHRPGDKSMYSASDISLISDAIARSQMLMNISGLTSAMKTAIINAFNAVGWKDGSGQTYIDAIRDAFADDPEGGVVIDDYLSPTSPNPVENRVITEAINELRKTYEAYLVSDSASGDPAIFIDGANLPMKSVETEFETVQNLHGYTYPWIGGTDKNLLALSLDEIKKRNNYASTWDGNTFTRYGISFTVNEDEAGNVFSITVNGTSTAEVSMLLATNNTPGLVDALDGKVLTYNGCPSGGSADGYSLYGWHVRAEGTGVRDTGSGVTFNGINTSSGWNFAISIAKNTDVNNAVFKPMLRISTDTDATFKPYSNICPISGWDEVVITRVGKNLLEPDWKTKTDNGVTFTANSDGTVTATGMPTNDAQTNMVFDLKPGNYYFTVGSIKARYSYGYIVNASTGERAYKWDGTTSSEDCHTGEVQQIKIESGTVYKFILCSSKDIRVNNLVFYPMIIPSQTTDHTYEQYQSTEYTVQIANGGTKYDGALNVVTGELSVTTGKVVYDGSQEYLYNGTWTSYPTCEIRVENTLKKPGTSNIKSDKLQTLTGSLSGKPGIHGANDNQYVFMNIPNTVTTSEEAKTWFTSNPVTTVFELATPLVYQLTPTQIEALLGCNAIYANTGEVSVDYFADTKLYIDKVAAS